MRVLTVTSSYPRFPGDYHGSFIKSLCEVLHSKDLILKVLTPRTKTMKKTPSNFSIHRFSYLPIQRLELIAERTMKNAPLLNLTQLPAYLISAYINLLKFNGDIVHVHLAIPFGLLASLTTKPYVITCHGSDCTFPFEKPILKPFVRKAFRNAEKIIVVSEYIKNLAIKLGADPNKTSKIYLGVDVEKFKPRGNNQLLKIKFGLNEDRPVIGTLGRLVSAKRIKDLIHAANMLGKEIQFVIGGDGPNLNYLRNISNQLGLRNIKFLGQIRNPSSFHQMCDIFVLTSIREGLSISLQEAMSSGCVPVAVNSCGCPELIKHEENGFLFKPGNFQDLAKKIDVALEHPELGVKARETIVNNFDINKNALEYIKVYQSVLESRTL